MIFEIKHKSQVIEYAQAKDVLHLITSYNNEYSGVDGIVSISEITEEEAKVSPLRNTEYDEDEDNDMSPEIMLFDLVCGNDFAIFGSTEF